MAGCMAGPVVTDPGTDASATPSTSPVTTAALQPWSPGPWRDVPCDVPPTADGPLPDLLVVDRAGNLGRFTWEGTQVIQTASAGPGIAWAIAMGPFMAASIVTAEQDAQGDWRLVLRDSLLAPMTEVEVAPVTAMAAHDGFLYVATRWNLTAYDAMLNELGSVELEKGSAFKGIDEIRVAGGYAYLLDDVMMPFLVFRVAVRDPSNMEVTLRHDTSSTTTPTLQWLDEETGTWYVEHNFYGQGGGLRTVVPISVEDGSLGTQLVLDSQTFPDYRDQSSRRETGYRVLGSTFHLPAWGLLGGEVHSIARIGVHGESIERSCMTPIGHHTGILEHENLLVTWGRTHVAWHQKGDPMKMRAEGTLSMVPVRMALVAA